MVKRFVIYLVLLTFSFSDEFSDGPYGSGFFDTAGPFSVPDLNMSFQGDVNFDEIINIQDIILIVGHILGNNMLQGEQFNQADINDENIQNTLVLEITTLNPSMVR